MADHDDPIPPPKRSRISTEASDKIENGQKLGKSAEKQDTESSKSPSTPPTTFQYERDAHIQVLLAVEYHGTNYGGWQRQGPKNKIKFLSVQGTLEQAATQVCSKVADEFSVELIATKEETGDKCALMSGSSGRTDRGVHAFDHKCLLRLPFSKQYVSKLAPFLVGGDGGATEGGEVESSPFLTAMNEALASDIHVRTCRIVNKQKRKCLRFGRKRYTYLLQQANPQLNRPWPAWNDYSYFVKQELDVDKMQKALALMEGTHDFLPLSCQKGKPNTVRTLHKGTITVVRSPFESLPWFQKAFRLGKGNNDKPQHVSIFDPPEYGLGREPARNGRTDQHLQLNPKDYKLIQIDFEGGGFLRHQVRRMVSVIVKVGEGEWEPGIVHRILHEEKNFLQGRALAPGRALFKAKVWIDEQSAINGDEGKAEGTALDEEDE